MTDSPPPTTELSADASGLVRPAGASRLLGVTLGLIVVAVVVAAVWFSNLDATTGHYLFVSMGMFAIGAIGVLMRRNALVLFMCVELMLNAANLAFVAFARMHGTVEGHVVVLLVIVVAAAEVAVGLAIIVSIFRRRHSANVDDMSLLRW